MDPLSYGLWFARRYGLQLELRAEEHLQELRERLRTVQTRRELWIYAFAHDAVPADFRSKSRSLDARQFGISARADGLYNLWSVTGLDFEVQGVVLSQGFAVFALLHACMSIEETGGREFAFVCRSATHRSVALCVLLAAIVYQNAKICLTTQRTLLAASGCGMG